MNKQTFKSLRSQFRKISRDAFRTGGGSEAFCKNLREGEKAFREQNPTEFFFNWFEKPSQREQVVSMKVFIYQDYPFSKFQEPKWN